jgi:hypothetical protein
LGGYLTDAYNGDVGYRSELSGQLARDVRQGIHARKVMASYQTWFGEGPELSVLRMLGLFDRPADEKALGVLLKPPAIPGLTESLTDLGPTEWRMILAKLRRAKLLAREDTHNPAQLDTHPLIREYFGEQLRTQQTHAWKECNRRLFHYYRTLAPQLPDSFRDMEPLFLAVICGCNAGLFRQALHEVYIPRIQRGDSCFAANFLGARGALPYPHSSASPLPLFGQTLGTVKAYHGKPSYTLSLQKIDPKANEIKAIIDPVAIGQLVSQACRSFELLEERNHMDSCDFSFSEMQAAVEVLCASDPAAMHLHDTTAFGSAEDIGEWLDWFVTRWPIDQDDYRLLAVDYYKTYRHFRGQ